VLKPLERRWRQNDPFGDLLEHGCTEIGNAITMIGAKPAGEIHRVKLECGDPTLRPSTFFDPPPPGGGNPETPVQPRMARATDGIRAEGIIVVFTVILEALPPHAADRTARRSRKQTDGHRPPRDPRASGALKPGEPIIATK
jgi:hypothetical protein